MTSPSARRLMAIASGLDLKAVAKSSCEIRNFRVAALRS
jgi:hypothetical protein